MPKAILLGRPHATYDYVFGIKTFRFVQGVEVEVPVVVALALQRRASKGKPMFEVRELPAIVERVPVQNVVSALVVSQLRFGSWPSRQQ